MIRSRCLSWRSGALASLVSLPICFPAEVCGLVRAFESGLSEIRREIAPQLLPLFKDLFIEPNPVPMKTALGWRGVDVAGNSVAALRNERRESGAIAQNAEGFRIAPIAGASPT